MSNADTGNRTGDVIHTIHHPKFRLRLAQTQFGVSDDIAREPVFQEAVDEYYDNKLVNIPNTQASILRNHSPEHNTEPPHLIRIILQQNQGARSSDDPTTLPKLNLIGMRFHRPSLVARLDGSKNQQPIHVNLAGAQFDSGIWSGVNATGSTFAHARFISFGFSNSTLDHADLRNTVWTGRTPEDTQTLRNTSLVGADFSGATIQNMHFTKLSNEQLHDTNFKGTIFSNVHFHDVHFEKSQLEGAIFDKDCRFRNCTMPLGTTIYQNTPVKLDTELAAQQKAQRDGSNVVKGPEPMGDSTEQQDRHLFIARQQQQKHGVLVDTVKAAKMANPEKIKRLEEERAVRARE